MTQDPNRYQALPLGVVIRRTPGVTRWAKWAWKATAVLPGAGPADWHVMRSEGDVVEYHAATVPLELHATDTEGYAFGLGAKVPSLFVVMRPLPGATERPFEVLLATASPYEAQDYCDSGEEVVEKLPMPPAVLTWVSEFIAAHHVDEPFKKRRRNKLRVDRHEDGVGDPRISTVSDVYASPALVRRRKLQ